MQVGHVLHGRLPGSADSCLLLVHLLVLFPGELPVTGQGLGIVLVCLNVPLQFLVLWWTLPNPTCALFAGVTAAVIPATMPARPLTGLSYGPLAWADSQSLYAGTEDGVVDLYKVTPA
jgi:hypothetical protein